MFNLSVKNHLGDMLTLTDNPNYTVTRIEGLTPPQASITSASNANFDGSIPKNSRLGERNIVIEVIPNFPTEQNRINLYKYFKSKKQCTIYFKNSLRDVYIEGIVESFESTIFDEKEIAQISIICHEPYFKDRNTIDVSFSTETSTFEFEFELLSEGIELSTIGAVQSEAIFNAGDSDTGFIITIEAFGNVTNPSIWNENTGQFFIVNQTLRSGDIVRIDTRKNNKGVTLNRNGVITNILSSRANNSTWLTLESGNNLYYCQADSNRENMVVSFNFNPLYEGV